VVAVHGALAANGGHTTPAPVGPAMPPTTPLLLVLLLLSPMVQPILHAQAAAATPATHNTPATHGASTNLAPPAAYGATAHNVSAHNTTAPAAWTLAAYLSHSFKEVDVPRKVIQRKMLTNTKP